MTITTRTPPLPGPSGPAGSGPDHPAAERGVAAWCAQHRWRTLLAGLLVLAGAVVLLAGGLRTTSADDQLVGDSALAQKAADTADFGDHPIENVVVHRVDGAPLGAAQVASVTADLTRAYQGQDGVAGVGRPVLSADRRTMLLPVGLAAVEAHRGVVPAGRRSATDAVVPMLARTTAYAAAHRDLTVGQVGPGSIDREVATALGDDFRRAELISLPVTLGVLLVAFGAVVAAGVPVLLGIGAVVTALGLTAWASRQGTPVDQNTQSLVLLIGLAVGVDYALFVVRRSREERAAGYGVREAVARAGRSAGRAVLISGATVVVAMSGMLVAGGMFTSLAIGAILVVAVAVLASATVLPALLAVLGDRVESLRLPFSRRRAARRLSDDTRWARLAGHVAGRPVVWTVAAGGLLLALAAPALGMRTSLAGAESLPRTFSTVAAYERLTQAFPSKGTTVDVVVTAPAADSSAVEKALRTAMPAALATGQVADPPSGVAPQDVADVRVSTDRRVHVLALPVPRTTSDPRLGDAVDAIRADVVPAVKAALPVGADVRVGGAAAVTDLTRWLDQRLPLVVAFVLVLTFVVMLLSFGSTWLAGATVALNLLSVGAAYGIMVLVFQHTWAQGLLGFTSIGSIAAWIPLLMFVVLFGLSMDYHVFVVSRVREAFTAGSSPREAVRLGVGRSAGVVTSAAAVMVAVFSIFGTLSSLEMKELGVGLATAVLLDATLVRAVLLPAVLSLLGRRAHTGPRWVPVLHH